MPDVPHQGPRADVLAERIEHLGSRFDSVERRINHLATKDELVQMMSHRDSLVSTQQASMSDAIRELSNALANERSERKEADRENENRSVRARNTALSAIGLVITVILGLIALINNLGGTPV